MKKRKKNKFFILKFPFLALLTSSCSNFFDIFKSSHSDPLVIEGIAEADNLDYSSETRNLEINGGAGNDVINGGAGSDNIDGGAGSDNIDGGAGSDNIDGGAGSDNIDGGAGSDNIDGGEGSDNIDGGAGSDNIDGGEGSDNIDGGAGSDNIDGGEGNDTVNYKNSNEAVNINLARNIYTGGHAQGDSLINVENISGSSFSDIIIGNQFNNTIYGDISVTVNNTIYEDISFRVCLPAVQQYIVRGNGVHLEGSGDDEIYGGEGDDEIYGGEGDDEIYGGEGDDEIYGGEGDDEIYGGEGDDEIYGGEGDDEIYGGEGDDEIYGFGGNDRLEGGGGNDIIYALGEFLYIKPSSCSMGFRAHPSRYINGSIAFRAGNDVILGGAGDDIIFIGDLEIISIDGGEGFDSLSVYYDLDIDLTIFEDDFIVNIERINLTSILSPIENVVNGKSERNKLTLSSSDITKIGGFNLNSFTTLIVEGSSVDSVITTDTWTANGTLDYEYGDGIVTTYDSFIQGEFKLLISSAANVYIGYGELFDIDENTIGELGTVVINHDLELETLTYSISDTTNFSIDEMTGELSLIVAQDYEINESIELTVIISDGTEKEMETVLVRIGDKNDNAPEITTTIFSIDEGTTGVLGIITITDEDTVGAIFYRISDSNFSIDSRTGELSLSIAQTGIDDLRIEVTVSDGVNSSTGEIIVTINNQLEITAVPTETIDGEGGFDTLNLNGDFDLDLTNVADDLISNIEKIDLTGIENIANSLTLSSSEITALGGFDTGNGDLSLIVDGGINDSIFTTDDWTANGTLSYDGTTYNLFEQGAFQLLLGINVDTSGIL